MNNRNFFRAVLVVTAVAAALGSGLGCLPSGGIPIFGSDFTPAFTLDRQPVDLDSNGQPIEDPSLGPYTRAAGEVASLLFPDVAGIDHLIQADCFWAARGPSGGGDLLRLNWEVYGLVAAEYDGKYLPAGDEDVSSCRMNDPLTRQPKHFFSPTAPQLPTMIVMVGGWKSFNSPAIEDGVLDDIGVDFAFENGAEGYGVSLAAVRPASANTDRTCNLGDFSGSEVTIGPGVWSYDAGSDINGRVAFCSGQGRQVIPVEDARFRASLVDGPLSADQWFDAVLVAGDGERIVRPAAVQSGGVAWSIPTSPDRWDENFSPSIRIDEIRLLRRVAGTDSYLDQSDLQSQTLCVRAAPGDAGCLYQMGSNADGQGHAVWRPLAPPPGVAPRNLTPGYDVDVLGVLDPEEAITSPLEWLAVPRDPSALFFEFRLTVVLAPIAVRIDALAHFGQVPPGETRYRRLTVTNFGGRSVSIDVIEVIPDRSDPGEFSVMVLGDPKPVPIAVEIVSADTVEVKLGADYLEMPVYRVEEHEGATLLLENDLDGQQFEINGHRLTFDGPSALHADPRADFQAPLPKATSRPFNLISNLPLPLPQNLPPGDNLGVRVRFQPGPPGERTGSVRVDYHDPIDGTPGVIEAAIFADVLWGPDPVFIPPITQLSDRGPGQGIRNLMLGNVGDLPLRVYDYAVIGPNYDRINLLSGPAPSFQVPPAQDVVFTLEYLDVCASFPLVIKHEAELWVDTDVGEISAPIRMDSVDC